MSLFKSPEPFRFDLQQFADPVPGDPAVPPAPAPVVPPAPAPTPQPAPVPVAPIVTNREPTPYEIELRKQAESARLRAEAAEADAKKLRDMEEERTRQTLLSEKKYQEVAALEKERADRVQRESDEKIAAANRVADEKVAAANKGTVYSEVRALAIKAGIVNPDDIKLLDLSTLKAENGEVTGAEALVEKLKTDRAHWFAQPAAPPAPPNPNAPPVVPPRAIVPPVPGNDPVPPKDWTNAPKADFKAERARIMGNN